MLHSGIVSHIHSISSHFGSINAKDFINVTRNEQALIQKSISQEKRKANKLQTIES